MPSFLCVMIWTCDLRVTPYIYPIYLYECLSCSAPNVDVSTTTNRSDTEPTRLTRGADSADGNLARMTRASTQSSNEGAESVYKVERKQIQIRFWRETQT